MLTVGVCKFKDIFSHDNFEQLAKAYADESGNKALTFEYIDYDYYYQVEEQGVAVAVKVLDDTKLVGFGVILLERYPHFNMDVGAVESIFVDKASRKNGGGIQLINGLRELAKLLGLGGLYFSAPYGSALSKIYSRLFEPKHTVYFCKV